jgi:hypothetical protein
VTGRAVGGGVEHDRPGELLAQRLGELPQFGGGLEDVQVTEAERLELLDERGVRGLRLGLVDVVVRVGG